MELFGEVETSFSACIMKWVEEEGGGAEGEGKTSRIIRRTRRKMFSFFPSLLLLAKKFKIAFH